MQRFKGTYTHHQWLRRAALLTATLVLVLSFCSASIAGSRIAIVLSDNIPAYKMAVAATKEILESHDPSLPQVETVSFNLSNISRSILATRLKALSPQVIVTVGTRATTAVVDLNPGPPIVFSMVLDPPPELLCHKGVTGVLLDIPPDTLLWWISRINPDAKRICVIHTQATERWVQRLKGVSPESEARIVPMRVSQIAQLPGILERLEKNSDVLLAVPDGTIYNSIISPQIILFCLQHRIPFIGLSSNFTRAGALFALDCDYHSIGLQTGNMVKSILQGNSAASLPLKYPKKVVPCFNMRTARILGITIDDQLLEEAIVFAD